MDSDSSHNSAQSLPLDKVWEEEQLLEDLSQLQVSEEPPPSELRLLPSAGSNHPQPSGSHNLQAFSEEASSRPVRPSVVGNSSNPLLSVSKLNLPVPPSSADKLNLHSEVEALSEEPQVQSNQDSVECRLRHSGNNLKHRCSVDSKLNSSSQCSEVNHRLLSLDNNPPWDNKLNLYSVLNPLVQVSSVEEPNQLLEEVVSSVEVEVLPWEPPGKH